jgi:hypothetical protein
MARAYGSNASLLLKRESAYGQQASGNYYQMPFTSTDLSSEQGLIEDAVLGYGRDPLQPLRDVINDDGDIAVPVDPRYLGFWLTGLFGNPISTAVAASGFIDFSDLPSINDSIIINGTEFTFVATSPAGDEIEIASTVIQTVDNAVSQLNASSDGNVTVATYSRPTGTSRLVITHDTAGAAGNVFTLAKNCDVATLSNKTLLGGGTEHVFISGKDLLPSYSIQIGMPKVPAYFMHTGVVMNSIAFDFQRSGAASATINAIAQAEKRYSATQGGTAQTLTFQRISQFQGAIKSGGQPIGNLTAGSISYNNNLERIETIRDDGLIDGADPTIAALTGTIEVRFADTSLIDLASAGTPVDLEFSYTLSPSLRLQLLAHEVYLPKPKLSVDGPGGVQASFDFQGAYNVAAGKMLTVKLLNDLDGSEYL